MSAGVHLDYVQRPAVHRLEVVGASGNATCDLLVGRLRWRTSSTEAWVECLVPPDFERNTLFLDEIHHFRQVVEQGVDPVCGLDDGVACLTVALAALEAGRRSAPLSFEANPQPGHPTELPGTAVADG
jgi:hypothetical protein